MKKRFNAAQSKKTLSLCAVALVASTTVFGQKLTVEIEKPVIEIPKVQNPIEEVVIQGRLQSAAANIVTERITRSVVVDIIGSDQISRLGDSNVAQALVRVPGVTLIDDKFVYVRGLGERYVSTQLNGAVVPSPDLTRNVIPLNIFPTSIVESLSVQKTASSDKTAAFGGGIVDIRTKGIPDDRVFNFEIGSSFNTESRGDFLTYNGGSDSLGEDDGTRALSPIILQGINNLRGSFDVADIVNSTDFTLDQARELNRNLASELYRDASVLMESVSPNVSAEINYGDILFLDNGIELGFLGGVSYSDEWTKTEKVERVFSNPEEEQSREQESTHAINLNANLNVGFRLNELNSIETTTIFLRNSEDDTSISNIFTANRPRSGLSGLRNYNLRFEQRELFVNQIHGDHELDSLTLESLGLGELDFLENIKVKWYVSDSKVTTDIPNELLVQGNTLTDEQGRVLSSTIDAGASAADYRFTELNDDVTSSGIQVAYPFYFDNWTLNFIAGSDSWQKTRTYKQLQFALGTTALNDADPIFNGNIGEVFSDENILNPVNEFEIEIAGSNSESYVAVNKVDAVFGQVDTVFDETWRFVAGVRYENYQQVNLQWNPLNFNGSQIIPFASTDAQLIADYFDNAVFTEDDYFGSFSFTYMTQGFGADDFNLRFGFSQTTVRPDLREISSSSYIDPLTGVLVFGNPDVIPSKLDNFDIRAEWFNASGDNFSVSLFGSDIQNPIELFEAAAGDENIASEVHNAESGETLGLEIEFFKNLHSLSPVLDPFFMQGNVTFLDHELNAGASADSPTNVVRGFAGASDFSGNFILGFDSEDAQHTATIAYNYFSERLFSAGRLGSPDVFEQPFSSLNFTYSFYPTDTITLKFKANNILNERLVLEQNDVEILDEKKGQTFSFTFRYAY